MKYFLLLFLTINLFLLFPKLVSAHVVVKPNSVGAGAFQTFTVGVPVEKDMATTQIRLAIPDGVKHVTPNVKPGWTIELKKQGQGEDQKVTEILWTGGSIPTGFRDDFLFSAQVPAQQATLQWKAYQTYADGTVVSWDKDPKGSDQPTKNDGSPDFSTSGPLSQTNVTNDLKADQKSKPNHETKKGDLARKVDNSFLLGIVAIVLSAAALGWQILKNRKG